MVLVEADAFDVVPRGGLVAQEALLHTRVRLSGYGHRNHSEVFHVMTRRRLMALSAVARNCGWMAKFRDGPLRCGVALRAVRTEQAKVLVPRAVAIRTIE